MHLIRNLGVITVAVTVLLGAVSNNFTIQETTEDLTTIHFQVGEFSTVEIGETTRIQTAQAGRTTDTGMPELPVYSTMFRMEPGVGYDVTYSIQQSRTLRHIDLFPAQEITQEQDDHTINEKNFDFYNSSDIYPVQNLTIGETMVMRGLEVATISFIPFQYHPETKELIVFEDVQIQVAESGSRELTSAGMMPPSRAFEPLYRSLIVNYETCDRDEDFQQPAILYICGGGSTGAITNPMFQDLVEWRHQRGYVVYTAHTGTTGSNNNSIKDYIENAYDTYDPPPEYVALVGDTGGSFAVPHWTSHSGDSDHPYMELEGNDYLPEVLVGRLSVSGGTDLAVVIDKTIAYEKAEYMANNWFEKSALCGDPTSSGLSAVVTNEYIENIQISHGMEDVRVNRGSGNYATWMQNNLDEGMAYMNYRGYIGTSSFGSSHINNSNNGYMTPFITFITCSTGSFGSSWGTAIIEDFIRAGTINNPKGAVAAIGTATSSTHTAPNNIVDMGIYDGLFAKGIECAAGGLVNGKISLYNTYPSNPSDLVGKFTAWNNLMGDPALHVWTDTPTILTVDYPESVGIGGNFIEIAVTDEDGNAVENAFVTLVNNDDSIFISGMTDEFGIVSIELPVDETGDVTLTVTKRNCKPHIGEFTIYSDGPSVNITTENITVDDSEGNGNGIANPGETILLTLPLTNFGTESAVAVQAFISSGNDNVAINTGTISFGDIAPGETADGFFEFSLLPETIDQEELDVRIYIGDSSANEWASMLPLVVAGAKLDISSHDIIGTEFIQPGNTGELLITLENTGSLDLSGVTAILSSVSGLLDVENDFADWGLIQGGSSVESGTAFTISASEDLVNGTVLPLNLHIESDEGYDRTETLHLQIGVVTVTDPLGPDNYGYYIYDSNDLGYSLAMPYDWIEIDPDHGGDGISLNMNDSGEGNPVSQQSAHVDLPFTFTFYGVDYDEITVSTNGWISFGDSELESFRNYPIPGAGGPSPMLAVFWDDLKTSGGGQVYKYINEEEEYVIIEWSEMQTAQQQANQIETFQAILLNSLTPTGDDEIILQYKEFNNTSVGNYSSYTPHHGCYSTVGIENHFGDDGLQYTFNDVWPTAAMELGDETALTITTRQPVVLLKGDVNQDGDINVQDIILVVNDIVNIQNLGALERYIADMDDNGIVNILDVIQMIGAILE